MVQYFSPYFFPEWNDTGHSNPENLEGSLDTGQWLGHMGKDEDRGESLILDVTWTSGNLPPHKGSSAPTSEICLSLITLQVFDSKDWITAQSI